MLGSLTSLPSAPGKISKKKGLVVINLFCSDLSLTQTSCRSLAISANGQYILLANENGLFVTSNGGVNFANKPSSSAGWSAAISSFGASNFVTLISNDGKYVVLYMPGDSTGTFQLSVDSGATFTSKNASGSTSGQFTLFSVAMSQTGQYLFVSGSGVNGGVFVSIDFGSVFARRVTSSLAQGCACSPNGRTIVVAANNSTLPWVSTNYGSSFSTFGTNTTYSGRRVFVHPDETYFAIRAVSPDAYFYTDLTVAGSTITGATTYKTLASLTPGDVEGYASIDQNGRFYFMQSNNLYSYDASTFATATLVPNLDGVFFSDERLCATPDGQYILGFNNSKLRLVRQFSESNTVGVTTSYIKGDGTVFFNGITLSLANRPLLITWSPSTVAVQPRTVAAGTTSVSFVANFVAGTTYAFNLSAQTADSSFITGRLTKSLLFSGPIPNRKAYWTMDNTLADSWNTFNLTSYNNNVTFTTSYKADGTYGASFNGSRQTSTTYTVLNIPAMSLTNNGISLSMWFYKDSNSTGDMHLFSLSGGVNLWCGGTSDSINWASVAAIPITKKTWYHVACTMTSSKVCNVWLNGEKKVTDLTSTLAYVTNVASGTIGGVPQASSGSACCLYGYIDEVRLYNGIFTAQQVSDLYNKIAA